MSSKILSRVKEIKNNFELKTLVVSLWFALITIIFAVYNGYLGIIHSSLWYGSICVYYIILSIVRVCILFFERKIIKSNENVDKKRRKVFIVTHLLIFLMNISLIVPISLMVKLEKPVNMTLIPAIASAAYTVYRVVISSINMKKKSKTDNLLVKELQTVNFIDALLAIIVLQNTLITVNGGGENGAMFILSAATSAVILLVMISLTVYSFVSGIKKRV